MAFFVKNYGAKLTLEMSTSQELCTSFISENQTQHSKNQYKHPKTTITTFNNNHIYKINKNYKYQKVRKVDL